MHRTSACSEEVSVPSNSSLSKNSRAISSSAVRLPLRTDTMYASKSKKKDELFELVSDEFESDSKENEMVRRWKVPTRHSRTRSTF